MEKSWNRSEPIRGESLTHAAAHKPPGQRLRTTALTCLNYSQCSLFNNKTETGQKSSVGEPLEPLQCFRTWMTYCNWWEHKFRCLPDKPEGEYLTMSWWPEAQECNRPMSWTHTNKSTCEGLENEWNEYWAAALLVHEMTRPKSLQLKQYSRSKLLQNYHF